MGLEQGTNIQTIQKVPRHMGNFGQAKAAGYSQLMGMFDDDNFQQTARYIRGLAKRSGRPGQAANASQGLARTMQGYQHAAAPSALTEALTNQQKTIEEQNKAILDLQGQLTTLQEQTPVLEEPSAPIPNVDEDLFASL